MEKLKILGLLLICGLLYSCTGKEVADIFNEVEGYMELHSDSALWLLNQIPHPEKLRGKQRADYALLLTQARDKNYLDSLQSDSLIKFAVDYYKDEDDKVKAGKALFYYGKVQALQRNDSIAMYSYLEAEMMLKETKEYKMQAFVQEYMGKLNDIRNMYDAALGNYQNAVMYYQKINDLLGLAYVYRNIARIYSVKCEYENVYEYINRGLAILQKYDNIPVSEQITASYYHIMGVTKRDEKDYLSAIDFLLKAISLEKNSLHTEHYSLSLGDVYLQMGKFTDAKKCFERVLLTKQSFAKAGAYHYLYLLEKKLENYKVSLAYKEKSDSLSAINLDHKMNNKLMTLQRKYEKDKLTLENLQLKQAKRSQLYLSLVILLLTILLSTILYVVLKQKYEKRFQNNLRIIAENEALIQKYVYELEVLKQKDGEIVKNNKKEVGRLKQKIILLQNENRAIRENVCVNGTYLLDQLKQKKVTVKTMAKQDQKQVLEYIDLIYGNFISRLREEYDLTDGDIMLAGLIKVGFTSADLIFTFGCAPNSFFKKKQRLRNGLHLEKDKKIEDFIVFY